MKDWRKELADQIRAAADSIYKEADRLADQPDYMVSDGFSITINFESDRIPTYTVRHEHLVREVVNMPTAGREWLHDLLQDAIDAGIITEAQAVRIMESVE